MDEHSLRVLEFDKILGFLKLFASSPGGRKKCETLKPEREKDSIEQLLKEVTEMRKILEAYEYIPIKGICDIKKSVERTRIYNFYLSPEALLEIKGTLEAASACKNFFSRLYEICPLIHRITSAIIPLTEIESTIVRSISLRGEILDTASPRLSEIRSRIKSLRSSIINALEKMLRQESLKHVFQEDYITLRNDRYVLPVRTDCKSAVPGVVHDHSQSRATFYIEPFSIINANNELQILRKEESFEEIRILTELTRLIHNFRDEILQDLDILERIDVIYAKALFSNAINASEPLVNKTGKIALRQCRHPILLAQFVEEKLSKTEDEAGKNAEKREIKGHWEFNRSGIVPIDLVKDNKTSILIITGANAGGKTVALKTLGLFTLMAQAGMHIPVQEGSELSVFENVFADIGDEQNIEASLSTFSAHMMRIDQIVKRADKASLVLLDELGSGTDPSEGSALALAILDYLKKSGSFIVVTTHLNLLKTYAYRHADVKNVSVEFDAETLKPTYNLVYGMPGISNALAIARNFGLPAKILNSAKQYLKDSDREIIGLIRGLEKTYRDVLENKKEIAIIRNQASRYETAAMQLTESIKNSRLKILQEFEAESRRLLRESEEELKKIIKEKKRVRLVRPGEEKEELLQVKKKLYDHFPKTAYHKNAVEHLRNGEVVRVSHLQKDGIVASVDEQSQRAEVVIGTMRIKVHFKDLEAPRMQNTSPLDTKESRLAYDKNSLDQSPQRVNVIGLRVNDALPVVDKTIDRALMEGIDTIEIIHGMGTGRLMRAIRNHLKEHKYVAKFSSGDITKGGAGITVVEIKG